MKKTLQILALLALIAASTAVYADSWKAEPAVNIDIRVGQ